MENLLGFDLVPTLHGKHHVHSWICKLFMGYMFDMFALYES